MNRYPGIQPFSKIYKDVFYGRDDDIVTLSKFINVNKLVVLHGKSGLGKSSLINAGLIPEIEKHNNYKVLFIRFSSYQKKNSTTLKKIFIKKIRDALPDPNLLYFQSLESDFQNISLWQYLKTLQWSYREKDGVLVILDQFEEVFTYPSIYVQQLAEEFSKIINDKMPDHLRKKMYQNAEKDEHFFEQHKEEVEFIENHPIDKFLIGIRSDKLSFLDRFSSYLPNILRNTYELNPLSADQARDAIVKPALKTDINFNSHPFELDSDLLKMVLSFLTNNANKTVEPFLLQILCQHFENVSRSKQEESDETPIKVERQDIDDLRLIVHNYYLNILKAKNKFGKPEFQEFERLLIRDLIERKLIDQNSSNRVSLDKSVVLQTGIEERILEKLIDSRIIRQEPNTVSGLSYEISHDTLIDPILQSSAELGNLEQTIVDYYKARVQDSAQLMLQKLFLDPQGKPIWVASPWEKEEELKNITDSNAKLHGFLIRSLSKENILRKIQTEKGTNLYSLFPLFIAPLQKVKNERMTSTMKSFEEEKKTGRRLRRRLIISTIAGTLLLGLSIFSYIQSTELTRVQKKT